MAFRKAGVVLALGVLTIGITRTGAVTRDVAAIPTFTLTFGNSVLNEMTFGTYRTPYDELQSRPYNLLFANIARMPNFGAWPGQQGSYARYVDGLIGNNGAANLGNDADTIEGTMIRRETGTVAWGFTAALLAGSLQSNDTSGPSTFSDENDLKAVDLRGAAAFQLTNSLVLGAGLRTVFAIHDNDDSNFEPGVGGFNGVDSFEQLGFALDAGVRQFLDPKSSWEISATLGYGSSTEDIYSESIDAAGVITDRFVSTNYDVDDLSLTVSGGYNRLRAEGLGETEFRGGLVYSLRELGNSNLAYTVTGGVTTPDVTLLSQDPIATKRLFASARSIFQAGETEVFLGALLGYDITDGRSQTDAAGTIVNESIDDSNLGLGITLGLRQPLLRDKLRIIVSGHGDFLSAKTATKFDAGSESDDATLTVAQFAVGLEAVLANVTLDFAWLTGEEAPVTPIPIGISPGARRTVDLNKLVLSAAVSW
jgi:hypothetical protein